MRYEQLLSTVILSACFIACNGGRELQKGNWLESNHAKLSELLRTAEENGVKSYAVFDFDNTTIVNDVENSLTKYQIEQLKYKIAPDSLFTTLTECLDDIDKSVVDGKSTRMIVNDICSDYAFLHGKFIARYGFTDSPERSLALEEIHKTDEYLDFRAKLAALYDIIGDNYDYPSYCLWIIKLFKGLSYDELTELTKQSCAYYSAMDYVTDVVWTSPDMGCCGVISASHLEGLKVTDEMKDLYNCLKDNGFDVYICSASEEHIVEAMACDPVYGLNIDEEHVFGLRMRNAESGIVEPYYDDNYIQTYLEGKTKAIKAYMAPEHEGNGPALVGGDSNGDYAMLVDFDDMKLGLIINAGNGGNIGKLSESGNPKYAVQGRNLKLGKLIPASKSI